MTAKLEIPQWFNEAVKKHETIVQMSTDLEVVKHFVAENTVLLREHTRRFDAIDRKFDTIDRKFDAIDRKFDTIDRKFVAVDARFEHMDHKMDLMMEAILSMASDIKRMLPIVDEFPVLKQRVDFHETLFYKHFSARD